jgi:TonB-dependent SusC/RagA subfamily outer membrane receptor
MGGIGSNQARPMLLIVDGAQVSSETINFLNVNSIETVEVLKYASASIYGMDGAGGVLVITSKEGGGLDPKDIASIGVLPITPIGFYKARAFYSPKYDYANTKLPDLRSTIYWNPEIKTDIDGNASFEYYNADGAGTYRVVIEGIDRDGNLGRQVFRYKVE